MTSAPRCCRSRCPAGLAGPGGEAALRSRDRLLSHAKGTLVNMHRISEGLFADWEISAKPNRLAARHG
jgi:hypothetical protein